MFAEKYLVYLAQGGMNQQSKKTLSIILAVLVSVVIIFSALSKKLGVGGYSFLSKQQGAQTSDTLQVVAGNSTDKLIMAAPIQNQIVLGDSSKADKSANASTTTDLLARQLLANYAANIQTSGTTTLSNAQAEAQARVLAQGIDVPQGTRYTTLDVSVSEDNSAAAITAYATETTKIIKAFLATKKTNDLVIMFEGSQNNDKTRTADIEHAASLYTKLIHDISAIKIPSLFAPLHVRLIQDYSDMQNGLRIMKYLYTDPVKALVGFRQYQGAANDLFSLQKDYQTRLQAALK